MTTYVKRISVESEGQVVTESLDTFPKKAMENPPFADVHCTPLKSNMLASLNIPVGKVKSSSLETINFGICLFLRCF